MKPVKRCIPAGSLPEDNPCARVPVRSGYQFEGTLEELKENAAMLGYPTDNLEDTFLALIEDDNLKRGEKR